jgi:hypothetical protein
MWRFSPQFLLRGKILIKRAISVLIYFSHSSGSSHHNVSSFCLSSTLLSWKLGKELLRGRLLHLVQHRVIGWSLIISQSVSHLIGGGNHGTNKSFCWPSRGVEGSCRFWLSLRRGESCSFVKCLDRWIEDGTEGILGYVDFSFGRLLHHLWQITRFETWFTSHSSI